MILHIIPDDKFTLDFINRTNKLFKNDFYFGIVGCKSDYEVKYKDYLSTKNVILVSNENRQKDLIKRIDDAAVIILHSLFLPNSILRILNRYILDSKHVFVWIIWGGDLYDEYNRYKKNKYRHPKRFIREYYRRRIIKHMDYVGTGVDYEALKERYKTEAKQLDVLYSYDIVDVMRNNQNKKLKVMIGHSATPTCRHIESFKYFERYKDRVEIICPLSYPNSQKYIDNVISEGKRLFGSSFTAITDFMNYDDYVRFLNCIDVGFFNNSRQQGNGNIINLLLLGKKVYLSKDNTLRKVYNSQKGYYVYNCEEIDDSVFLPLEEKKKEQNALMIRKLLSDEHFVEVWNRMYDLEKEVY